jgi:hypothetical protein
MPRHAADGCVITTKAPHPALSQQDTTHILLLASTAGAFILTIATRGRLGYQPERPH